jgi:hypothetical protein
MLKDLDGNGLGPMQVERDERLCHILEGHGFDSPMKKLLSFQIDLSLLSLQQNEYEMSSGT